MEENTGVADKLFSVLEYLALSQEPSGPTELAGALNMSKATVYRLLKVMTARGYAEKNEKGLYTAGPKLIEIASYQINNLELQVIAKPYLSMLYSELNLAAHLGALDGTDIVYIAKIDAHPTGPNFAQVGYRSPAYCSSIGKCLLASLSGDEMDEILYSCKFHKYTERTITNIYQLKEHLRLVRSQGWAMDNEEYIPGFRCVGAPIYDFRGDVQACLSVSGNTQQITDERLPELVEKIKDTAAVISRKMGYAPPAS